MRTSLLVPIAALVLSLWGCAQTPVATPADDSDSPVQVEFQDPARFRDLRDRSFASERASAAYRVALRQSLQRSATPRLQPGQRLDVTITDVDMAGDFEPWRWRGQDLRVVRDIYPPRIDLHFTLSGPDGSRLKSGERRLSDLNFLMTRLDAFDSDPLRYEKALLARWVRDEFGAAP